MQCENKLINNCAGGKGSGNDLCDEGYVGALCG